MYALFRFAINELKRADGCANRLAKYCWQYSHNHDLFGDRTPRRDRVSVDDEDSDGRSARCSYVARDAGSSVSRPINPTESRRRFALNAGSNVLYVTLNAVVSLWLTPYLVKHLGVAVYGLVPLANSVVSYMTLLTQGLNTATGRFLTIEVVRGDNRAANRTFNTALFGMTSISVIVIPLVVAIAIVAPVVFKVPADHEGDARWLFFLVGSGFVVGVIGSCFSVSAYALNRFDLSNLILIVQMFVRVLMVIAFFCILSPQVWQVGGATLAGALVGFGFQVLVWRILTPQLHIQAAEFDRSMLPKLVDMAGWVTLNTLGALLFLQIDLIVVNAVFGAEMTGYYGALLQFSVLLRALATALAGVLSPHMTARYTQGDVWGMVRVSRQAIKLLGLAVALPVGLLCGLAQPFLGIWLGPSFQSLDVLLVVMLGHLCVNLAVVPLFSVQIAANRVRWPGILTAVLGLANLGLALAWAKWGGIGVIGVAAAGALVLTAKNLVYTPLYCAKITDQPWWTFLPSIGYGAAVALGVAFVAQLLFRWVQPSDWLAIGSVAGLASLAYVGMLAVGALNASDRRLIGGLLPF